MTINLNLEQFVQQLTDSGLLSAADVATFQQSLPPQRRPQDTETLARELVEAHKLTRYQVSAAIQGKAKSLVFDEYVILDKLGQGGMGVVFKAEHRRMKRLVAIKIIAPASMKSPEAVRRFYREVEAAARLSHPNIVAAHDAREYHGSHCLVMEYVDGRDLAAIVKDHGPLPVRQAIECILQAARGLEFAHRRGVVHRDIKPANLLLDREGTVKILDMGLARVAGLGDEPDGERLTQSGQVMGTCDYMAPEQSLDTHKADHRADIYSLGCTLYRLVTGNTPFQGDTYAKLFMAHLNDPIPSMCAARPDVPTQLDAVLQRMMAKQPEDRYQSMTDVIADLERGLGSRRAQADDEESLSNGALAFLRESAAGGSATRQQAPPHTDRTLSHVGQVERGTTSSLAAQRNRRKWLLVSLGLAATVLVACGVVVIINHGRGKQTSLEVPDGSQVTMHKDGQVEVQLPGDEQKPSFAAPVQGGFAPALDSDLGTAATGEKIPHPLSRRTYSLQHAGRTVQVPLGMVYVPGGTFLMGDDEFSVSSPVHRVEVPAFFIDKYEVTNAQYQEFVRATGAPVPHYWRGNGNRIPSGRENHPVLALTWDEARAYARWCGKRLPTEAEWEKAAAWDAARSEHRKYPWGNTGPEKEQDGAVQYANTAYLWGHSRGPDGPAWHDTFDRTEVGKRELALGGATKPVGSFPAGVSPSGCYDMAGNAIEWVDGWFDAYPGASRLTDEERRDCGTVKRVLRGGGWSGCAARDLACGCRTRAEPDKRGGGTGLRCAADCPWTPAATTARDGRSPFLDADNNWKLPPGAPPPAIAPFDAKQASAHQEAWGKYLGLPVEMTNSIGMRFTLIPPGEFMMGSTPEEIAWVIEQGKGAEPAGFFDAIRKEGPPRRVRISRPFYLSTYEVTQAQYQQVMGVNPSEFAASGKNPIHAQRVAGQDTRQHPVEMVSCDEAIDFCRRLSALPAEEQTAHAYLLPEEAQWEYACRAGTRGLWFFAPTGNAHSAAQLREYASLEDDGGNCTCPVGQKKPNPWGLYDILGNVAEWLASPPLGRGFSSSVLIDPVAPSDGDSRAMRGGSCSTPFYYCRSAGYRLNSSRSAKKCWVGFRPMCAIDLSHTPAGTVRPAAQQVQPASSPFLDADNNWKLPPGAPPPAIAPFDAQQAREHQEAWAKYLGLPVETTNAIGMAFMLIPPGEFLMGSTPEETAWAEKALRNPDGTSMKEAERAASEQPRHRVRISRPFYFGKFEVTQAQYQRVTGVNPSAHAPTGIRSKLIGDQDTRQWPVDSIPHGEALEFCVRLTTPPKDVASGGRYTLPTEAQWEYACRAGTSGPWCFLWESTPDYAAHLKTLDQYAWFVENSQSMPHPVGQKRGNAWGLHDMSGNVWEWCSDWDSSVYYRSSPVVDPPGPEQGTFRIARGGSFGNAAPLSRSTWRGNGKPGPRFPVFGMRLVWEINLSPIPTSGARTSNDAKAAAAPPQASKP